VNVERWLYQITIQSTWRRRIRQSPLLATNKCESAREWYLQASSIVWCRSNRSAVAAARLWPYCNLLWRWYSWPLRCFSFSIVRLNCLDNDFCLRRNLSRSINTGILAISRFKGTYNARSPLRRATLSIFKEILMSCRVTLANFEHSARNTPRSMGVRVEVDRKMSWSLYTACIMSSHTSSRDPLSMVFRSLPIEMLLLYIRLVVTHAAPGLGPPGRLARRVLQMPVRWLILEARR